MDRRRFLLTSLVGALAAPLAAEAQQAGKIAKLGVLSQEGLLLPGHPMYEVFYGSLRKFGWVVGQNLILERRAAEGKPERLPELARELVGLNVDVIVVGSCGVFVVGVGHVRLPAGATAARAAVHEQLLGIRDER